MYVGQYFLIRHFLTAHNLHKKKEKIDYPEFYSEAGLVGRFAKTEGLSRWASAGDEKLHIFEEIHAKGLREGHALANYSVYAAPTLRRSAIWRRIDVPGSYDETANVAVAKFVEA